MRAAGTTRSAAGASGGAEPYRTGALLRLVQLHWFIRLRWVIIGLAVLALLGERATFPEAARPAPLYVLLVALVAINLTWTVVAHFLIRSFHDARRDEHASAVVALRFANAQVAADLFWLACVVRFCGGIESPLLVFFLFHMAIGALLLHGWHALLQGVWAVGLIAGLALGESTGTLTPHYPFLPMIGGSGLYAQPIYITAALVVFAAGIFGTLYFTLQIARRIDEREAALRRVNAALQTSQRAIQDLQARRTRFMQTAAHQLKGPLASIQTLVGLIRDGIVPAESQRALCGQVVQRCREGIAQVSELLTLARVQEADPRRHHESAADVGRIAQMVCERLGPLAESKGLRFACTLPADADLRACVDPGDLDNCLSNLVDNAIKYTPAGGLVTVSVARGPLPEPTNFGLKPEVSPWSGQADGEFVSVAVTDTGMGIESGFTPQIEGAPDGSIFDAFRRGNNALAAGIPGTGLGLTIVREVVEQAGGRLRVHSRLGEGSLFCVAFRPTGHSAHLPVRDTRASEVLIETGTAPPERGGTRPVEPDGRATAGAGWNAKELYHAG